MVKTAEEKRAYKREWKRKNAAKAKLWYASNKDHVKKKSREWVAANQERVRENQKRWRAVNKDKLLKANRKHWLKKFYGLTPETWQEMFDAQGRVCKCCGSPDPKAANGWHVDHCHETDVVRGILCQQCNIMIGCASDDPTILMDGARYLMLV